MKPRMHYAQVAPGAVAALRGLEDYVRGRRLERPLLELVRTRASQLNGCAYCVDMHTRDARTEGETEQRLHAVAVWRETPFFSDRERAALAWTEAVTLVAGRTISDSDYAAVREQFDECELVDLTVAIVAINGWNRMAVAFRPVPGSYQHREPDTPGAGEGG